MLLGSKRRRLRSGRCRLGAAIVPLPRPRKEDVMSSVPQQQQHLTSADMNMIIRVHAGACTRNAISAGSLDAKRLAAPLVSEFQHGVSEEPGLLAAFTADGAL